MQWSDVNSDYWVKIGTSPNEANQSLLAIVPSAMRYLYQDVDYDAGRVASGLMVRNKVGEKAKLEFTFPPTDNRGAIAALLQSVRHEQFYMSYFDPELNDRVTKKFYVGDRTVPVYNFKLEIWESISFNVVEF